MYAALTPLEQQHAFGGVPTPCPMHADGCPPFAKIAGVEYPLFPGLYVNARVRVLSQLHRLARAGAPPYSSGVLHWSPIVVEAFALLDVPRRSDG